MKIKFIGAAREVTGSKHLITTDSGKKILLDCGMFQGKGLETDGMNRNLMFNPSEIDHVILTHAHIDHSGLIPYIYKLGFRGSVICTSATRDLCAIMLADSGHIQEGDVKWFNKRRVSKGLTPVEPIYKEADARACMELFIGIAYDRKFNIDGNIKVKFTNTGHMLGSGTALLEITENGKTTRIAYTGDIGRPESRILKSPKAFPQCDCHVDMPEHFSILMAKELYYPNGTFSPFEMDKGLNHFFIESQKEGERNIRATAEMAWALEAIPGVEHLMAYESRLNYFIPGKPWISICLYNVNKFSGAMIMNVLKKIISINYELILNTKFIIN